MNNTPEKRFIKVLIVEDEPTSRKLVDNMLKAASENTYATKDVGTLKEAREMMSSDKVPYDVVLLDLNLPDSTGLDTLTAMDKEFSWAPIVVITGAYEEELGLEAVSKGAQDYLIKGKYDIGMLTKTILYAIDRKKLQTRLLQSEKMAGIGTMAASIAHELRTPLGVIELAVDNLTHYLKPEDEKVKVLISNILKKIRETEKTINDILSYSRLSKPVFTKADINDVVKCALNDVRGLFLDYDIKITEEYENVPNIKIDEVQMAGVFQNIIKNAYESMDRIGHLEIKTSFSEGDGSIYVRISDTGCGVAKQNIEKMDKPFFTTKAKGIGLGLALSSRIIKENHKGDFEIVSDVDKGTTFIIKLPL
ncbi:MAG: response regulator [Candidatus Omnitrophica bacterium]|nr:response regulator [Candidatus Omnitrophota bacterium]MDD5488233.1 response regulator [Candidatus Omnitrophota bacterium]